MTYVANPFLGRRRPTREVSVGDVRMGGENPIRVQSMTTTDTLDTQATADQTERLADAGCEIVRITAPSIREAENLRAIAAELAGRRVRVPLVADIHFTPNAALIAAQYVDKVRVNPGNYADKKKFEVREYTDSEYGEELERVAARFRPLVLRCRERGVAMRIGTNHGSLSDRIMNRYGDTPLGMVESALEFLAVCEDEGYGEVVFSMKSSNPQVAIQAYRLLAQRLDTRAGEEAGYPFHVGVTEAGDAEDGRIKSAIGIGALLEDGIGDTIRVSLTEDPVKEIPVARALARRAEARWREDADPARAASPPAVTASPVADPFSHQRRETKSVAQGGLRLGGEEPVRVELGLGPVPAKPDALAARVATACALSPDLACEGLRVEAGDPASLARVGDLIRELARVGVQAPLAVAVRPDLASPVTTLRPAVSRLSVEVRPGDSVATLRPAATAAAEVGIPLEWSLASPPALLPELVDHALAAASEAGLSGIVFSVESTRETHATRVVVSRLRERGAADVPLVLRHSRAVGTDDDAALLDAAVDLGSALCDGLGDAVSIAGFPDPSAALDLAYRILQGARLRTTRTEYISCPSCGRTLFDLEETTARVKAKTSDLKGVKIAVMGCIVNGPGEMADADFGYVGAGVGRVNLYVGKDVIARGVHEAEAPDRLVEIIREHGARGDAASDAQD